MLLSILALSKEVVLSINLRSGYKPNKALVKVGFLSS